MSTSTRHPLAEAYLAELARAAQRLPRRERAELVAELTAHIDEGLARATSEADVRNLLDALGPPQEIVAAAAPSPTPAPRSYGQTALILGVIAVVIGLLPLVGAVVAVPMGIAAIVIGVRERREGRRDGGSTAMATGGVAAGGIAIVVPLVFLLAALGAVIVGSDSSVVEEGPIIDVERAPEVEPEFEVLPG